MASKELVISQNRHETKVAILEDGQLVEVYFQRANEYSLAGSIHKGRVTRVLPGMQSAFVDLGLDRDTFLYVSDFFEEHGDEYDKVSSGDDRDRDRDRDRGRGRDRDRGGRDRDRERSEAPAVAQEARVEEAIPEREPEPVALPALPPVSAQAPAAQTDPGGQGDRRGRRSRRRRRGARGFPDSKYAAAPAEEAGAEPLDGPDEEAALEPEVPVNEAAPEEIFLLPGESLAKYRRPHEPEARQEREPEEIEEPEPQVVISPEETSSADDAAEQVLDRVEEIEEMGNEPQEETAAELEEPEEPEGEPEMGAEEDEGPEAEAEGETGAESEAEPEGEAAKEEEGVEPARMPQSLTATLRAQGGRFAHRAGGRRMRRRGGRGGPQQAPPPLAGPEVVEPPAEVVRPAAERVERTERGEPRDRGDRGDRADRQRPPLPSIADLLKEGQEIIVQIAKEPLGQKGARITSHIALPGRYVVYMPTVEHLGVSRKISTDEERLRLKRILQKHREGMPGGFIMRTAGEGKTEDDIASDMRYLANLWLDIRTKAEKRRAPALLHHDVQVVERLLRDQFTEGFKAVWVDNEELYQSVLHGVERMQPALLSRVKLYTRNEPIFDAFGITQELEKRCARKCG